MTISELVKEIGASNRSHGIYAYDFRPAEYLMQIVSEAAEAYEELRKGYPADEAGPALELADIVLACCGYAAYFGVDLEAVIKEKLAREESRPYKHGKEF